MNEIELREEFVLRINNLKWILSREEALNLFNQLKLAFGEKYYTYYPTNPWSGTWVSTGGTTSVSNTNKDVVGANTSETRVSFNKNNLT